MKLLIRHNGQEYGPYTLEEASNYLSAGSFLMTDLARPEGTTDWQPLSAITGLLGSAPPPLPAHLPPPLPGPGVPPLPQPRTSGISIALMICGAVVAAIMVVAILAGIAVPVIIQQQKRAACVEAMANLKVLGMALYAFDQEYGRYPCDATIEEVKKHNPDSALTLGTSSSNDCMRQLIASGMLDSVTFCYAHIKNSRKPDKRMEGSHAVEKGECGFSYLIGPISNSDPPQPLLATPLVPGTDRFDRQPFGGKAVILWTDGLVSQLPIEKDGRVLHLGVHLLDLANPVWHGKPPRITWPE